MRQIWKLTINDYINIVELAKLHGKKVGESIEDELRQYMKERGQKSVGHTELTHDEMLKEYASKGQKVLSMETKDDKTIFKIPKVDIF
jgi:hypothetical protein